MYVCMYVINVLMYVCMYVCMYVYIIYIIYIYMQSRMCVCVTVCITGWALTSMNNPVSGHFCAVPFLYPVPNVWKRLNYEYLSMTTKVP